MSNIVANSNRESTLLRLLSENTVDPYKSYTKPSFPNGSMMVVPVDPIANPPGAPQGRVVSFRIPRYGLLQSLVVESTLTNGPTTANDAALTLRIGERVFSQIRLTNSGREICQMSSMVCENRGRDAPMEKAIKHAKLVYGGDTQSADAAMTCYTPVYMDFFEDTDRFLPTDFCEALQVDCTVNSAVGMGLTNAQVAGSFKIWATYRVLDTDEQRAYLSSQFSGKNGAPLTLPIYNYVEEVTDIANGVTSTTLALKAHHAVCATTFAIRSKVSDVGSSVGINNVTVRVSGSALLDAVPTAVLRARETMFDNSGVQFKEPASFGDPDIIEISDERPVTVYWGDDKSRLMNSGAVSLANVANPSVTIVHDDPGAAAELVITHRYMKLITIDSTHGKLSTSLDA